MSIDLKPDIRGHNRPDDHSAASSAPNPAMGAQGIDAAMAAATTPSVVKLKQTLALSSPKIDKLHLPIIGWDDIINIGDQVILDVVDHVFHYRPRRVSNELEHVLGIGSLFFLASIKSHIWGTGILTSYEPIPEIRPNKIHALRGLKTADRLTREGYHLPDVPFGDPGIFVSEYVTDHGTESYSPNGGIVLIPHHSSHARWMRGGLANSAEVEILDPCTNKMAFLRKIRTARVVISESLHGIVFATAFKKPVVWVGDADADLFKYHDWFSMIDSPPVKPLDANAGMDQLVKAAQVYEHRICVDDLRQNFPHEVAAHLPDNRIGYEAARDQHPFCFFFQNKHWPFIGGRLSATLCFDLASSVADVIFDHWDDRPYALGMTYQSGILPNRRQLDRILYEMDHHLCHDFAIIASKQQVAQASLQTYSLTSDLSWATGELTDASTVLIRPSGSRRGDNYIIFCI